MLQNTWNSFLIKLENKNLSFLELYIDVKNILNFSSSVLSAEQEARWLLEYVFGNQLSNLLLLSSLDLVVLNRLKQVLHERLFLNKPLAYIIGYVYFCGLKIFCKPPVLIPRSETEDLVNSLIKRLDVYRNYSLKILDLCSGSGCIGFALAESFPNFEVLGVDLNQQALDLAQHNKKMLGLKNINFLKSDLFENLGEQKFDIVVSNPPYIPHSYKDKLSPEVVSWESDEALFADDDGLILYKKIAATAHCFFKESEKHLKLDFNLVLEFSPEQLDRIKEIFSPFGQIDMVFKDLFDRDRGIFIKIKSKDL